MLMKARAVVFSAPKRGNTEKELEDCAASRDLTHGDEPRYIVVDGATEAYDSVRWADHLVSSFVGVAAPQLTSGSMRRWFAEMQTFWQAEAPARVSYIEERAFAQGSFATLLGCELVGLTSDRPTWHAAALGDTVLFHVRNGRLLTHFPELQASDFGRNPDGVHTSPTCLDNMVDKLSFAVGDLQVDDLLFLATDAFAEWMVRVDQNDEEKLWNVLRRLDHPLSFERLVNDQRDAGRMRNDDVTLLRVCLAREEPKFLVLCLP